MAIDQPPTSADRRPRPAAGSGGHAWRTALRRTPAALWSEDATDWAAALTYYAVLTIFPALLVTLSVIGLAGTPGTQHLVDQVAAVVPARSRPAILRALESMAGQQAPARLLAAFGTVAALWSASSYLSVFRRAVHAMSGVTDRRPLWKKAPLTVINAFVLLTLLVSSALVLVLTGDAARAASRVIGVDGAGVTAWNIVKWPLLACLVTVLVLVLFRSGQTTAYGLRQRAVGGLLAVVLWLLASLGFTLYTTYAGTYDRLYGSLAGLVVFLVWLWMSNLALLTGAQFNAELAALRRP
ncbi:YihY/virulence factor BrkB family protein [Streptomyces canus]|uniref:YihY/virulence factor BrkB family protein n=1 Tax=Streptomyces canus TaxID=58343 RepID=UPI00224DB920|nr:YihY/virulence factor BrkB family protein [Streptomyces canus]MCX4862193.1 YihY/virulence factor BrkB family protein [Streptomyces canus]WSW32816.1 YihY/virulence factor BrkB family protein [Streptomyces canus]